MSSIVIRAAMETDSQLICDLIHALALYEKAPESCVATQESVGLQLFGERPAAECLIAELDGRPVGFALFFQSFSTWLCRPGMYLEDLFVLPDARKSGVGKALLQRLASLCEARHYGRMEWSCLEWNELAKSQYRKIGAAPMEEWRTWRLEGDEIGKLARG